MLVDLLGSRKNPSPRWDSDFSDFPVGLSAIQFIYIILTFARLEILFTIVIIILFCFFFVFLYDTMRVVCNFGER